MSESDPKTQIDKFRDMARELECDDDEAAFDERLRQISPKATAWRGSAR